MAITNSQQARQMYEYGGLSAPRQNYGLGKLVKKAFRGVKKIAKSPLGKAALIAGGGYMLGGAKFLGGSGMFTGGQGMQRFGNLANLFRHKGIGGDAAGKRGMLAGLFRDKDGTFSGGRAAITGLGLASMAPLFMGGGDDDDDGGDSVVEQINPAEQVARARNFYSGLGDKGVGLNFMPKKKYVSQNFYAADGGRANFAMGGDTDDDEDEIVRMQAAQRMRPAQAFLNIGGDVGNAQAEQMLMAEFVKYKNKGGDLSFEQFVKAVMQQQEQSQGMQQPMMAADGGRMGYAGGELVQDNMMMASSPSAGDDLNQSMEIFSIKIFGKELKDLTEDEYRDLEESLPDLISNSGEEQPMMAANGGMAGTSVPGYGTPAGTNKFGYPSGGVRVNAAEGGIMDAESAEMIDMGGNEKDYRDEGGFVAMGGEERADDVPARLSKNEFVFTADAVRNAGGGDIDRGSEVMQNLMDNLEQGGQVSEDSQGMGGGEEMMSEEIIEEPNGAQAMYEQQQALQSRMI